MLAGRDEQLRLKREEAEQQLKFQQAENELLQIAIDMNKSLEEETKRRRAEAQKIYGEDLAKQVEYNKLLAVSKIRITSLEGFCNCNFFLLFYN